MAAVCVALHTHARTGVRWRKRRTHVPNSHSCALSLSFELPSLWWRHFDSLPLLFLCSQFIFAGRSSVTVARLRFNRVCVWERERDIDYDRDYIKATRVRSMLLIWVTEVCVEERVLSEPVSGFHVPCRPPNQAVEVSATFAEQWKLGY